MSETTTPDADRARPETDADRERRFLAGAALGALVSAAGFVSLVLALSVHVRDPLPWFELWMKSVLFYGGAALALASAAVSPFGQRVRNAVAAVGAAAFLAGGSTAVTVRPGSPYVSQVDRWLIAIVSVVMLAVGYRLIRRAAGEVGW